MRAFKVYCPADDREAAELSCRTPHWLGAVGGAAEALAIFGPQDARIHTR